MNRVSAPQEASRRHYRFFGGKGGVGKTTSATAAAIAAAEAGRRVLIVSTDPAHSLGDALAVRLSSTPKLVPTSRGSLRAVELNADQALQRWMRKHKQSLEIIAEHGTYLDTRDIEQLLRLSLPGVDEMVGLVELRRLAGSGDYDEVIVDTAPTGHTLRLLAVPDTLRRMASVFDDLQAKHRFLSQSLGGAYRPDAGDRLIEEIDSEGSELIETLRDPKHCTFAWVLLPELLSVEEAKDGVAALTESGIAVSELIVNRVQVPPGKPCQVCEGRRHAERAAMEVIRKSFPGRTILFVGELEREPRGVAEFHHSLRSLLPTARWEKLKRAKQTGKTGTRRAKREEEGAANLPGQTGKAASGDARPLSVSKSLSPASDWPDLVAPPGCRLLLFGGKGGVGKTTCAATAALVLAERRPGRRILLLSTDPAHSLADVLEIPLGDDERALPGIPLLKAREIDAGRLFHKHREHYLDSVNGLFDSLQGDSRFDVAYDRSVARGLIDLSPPGLDEIFGILSVSEALLPRNSHRPRYDLVVVDTAPTGHALRLLEMPGKALEWVRALLSILLKYRDVTGLGSLASDLLGIARQLRQLLELLHDTDQTRLVAVTRAAELPRLETDRLLQKVRRMKIGVSAVLVNAVTPFFSTTSLRNDQITELCARCQHAAAIEQREMAASAPKLPKIIAPAVAPPPRGISELRRWSHRWMRYNKAA